MIQHFNYHLKSLHEIYDFSWSKKNMEIFILYMDNEEIPAQYNHWRV